jgi:PTS system glucose-specific IIC component
MNLKLSFLSKLPKRKAGSGAGREFIAKLSKGLMLPIAMLPIAGLFLGIGATIATQGANAGIEGLIVLGNFIKLPGDVIFGALPVLFAIAIAIAFTKDAGAAGLSALVGFLVFSGIQASLIVKNGDGYDILFYKAGSLGFADFGLPSSLFGTVLGIHQLQTSVFGGFIVGFTVAFLYNKFKDIQMPPVLGFFSGVRFIPVVTFAALFPITLLLLMV